MINDELKKLYEFNGLGLSAKEKNVAEARFYQYLEDYPHLSKMSDRQNLEDLVFQECLRDRLKSKIDEVTKINKKSDGTTEGNAKLRKPTETPERFQNQLIDQINNILALKNKLGLNSEKEGLDGWNFIQGLLKKAATYREKNFLAFKTTCIYCSEYYFLKRRTDCYEPFKSPFFEDKVLYNKPLRAVWRNGKITDQEYADILGVSTDYIGWLETKYFSKMDDAGKVATEDTDEKQDSNVVTITSEPIPSPIPPL